MEHVLHENCKRKMVDAMFGVLPKINTIAVHFQTLARLSHLHKLSKTLLSSAQLFFFVSAHLSMLGWITRLVRYPECWLCWMYYQSNY